MILSMIFSIHAPLTRGDGYPEKQFVLKIIFNPRPSHEGRRFNRNIRWLSKEFSIHAPLTRGDVGGYGRPATSSFSIHAPLTRGDGDEEDLYYSIQVFNPRPSHEGRLDSDGLEYWSYVFNPRPSHEGRRRRSTRPQKISAFQSTPLSRGATWIRTLLSAT